MLCTIVQQNVLMHHDVTSPTVICAGVAGYPVVESLLGGSEQVSHLMLDGFLREPLRAPPGGGAFPQARGTLQQPLG